MKSYKTTKSSRDQNLHVSKANNVSKRLTDREMELFKMAEKSLNYKGDAHRLASFWYCSLFPLTIIFIM